ncbi:glutamate-cysteine ligase family protein [Natronolimnohabitans sp. A-GB9]|uniref:glutamate-cysteine ligase family protein n=1 Tax=Natronolimnohabitans sp. A-GB9 TaxID=3069757 RepID=UPI0027B3A0C4|nr:glutamate-cysteine ligase family protein [Natronolimnohabitans sp. A-GB9]MDQ2050895.1 glutamate-cysteine ligase family protein [Natronolimnohabitans sp. A-GB9]
MKTSLEVEYWVVDSDGDLVSPDTLLDVSDQFDPEFVEPMLELKTTPCSSMAELREEFLALVDQAVDAARERDKRLVPLATPLSAPPAALPYRNKRSTDLQRRIVGPTFDDARACAGTHIHFEQSNVVDQLNTLTALDPAFSLVNSSAHYRGERILECARPFLYRRSCYETCPEQGQLWPYVDTVDEWEQRLESAYDGFRERALQRGVDPDTFDDEFTPAEAVWTPVRLREAMPTVEWRSPDAALPSQVLTLAAEVRSIVTHADARGTTIADDGSPGDDGTVSLPDFDTVETVTDTAIYDGIGDPHVQDYLEELGFTPSAYEPLADRLPDARLSKREAKRLRLEAATKLEADLERRRARSSTA